MPLYTYVCPNCELESDKRHPIDTEPDVICPKCDTPMRRKVVLPPHAHWRNRSRQKEEGRW